jgi:hypothetical protein
VGAVTANPRNIEHVPDRFKISAPEIYISIVEKTNALSLLRHVPLPLLSPEWCFKLFLAEFRIPPDKLSVKLFLKFAKRALKLFPPGILEVSGSKIYQYMMDRTYKVFRIIPDRFKTPEMCLIAVRKNPRLLRFVPEALRETTQYCSMAHV